jgi:60 kDa SS-A/Ro ribonucleoprotein
VAAWQEFVTNHVPLRAHDVTGPKLVCIDLQPYTTTQAPDRSVILNVGGFRDAVFRVVPSFLRDNATRFVAESEAIEL